MREEEFEIAIKVVIVGNGAVGKSSMIQRYCKGVFTKDYKKTIGVDFLERQVQFNGEEIRLMLWDTAGQEEFDAITKAYYRGAQACVLTFSTVDRDSFEAIESWKKKVEAECGEIPTVLVQNKIDLVDQATVSADDAEQLAKKLKLRFYRTSVKEDLNVSEVFRYLADKYLAQINSIAEDDVPETKAVGPKVEVSNSHPRKPKVKEEGPVLGLAMLKSVTINDAPPNDGVTVADVITSTTSTSLSLTSTARGGASTSRYIYSLPQPHHPKTINDGISMVAEQ